MIDISTYIIPLIVLGIIIYALGKNVNVYDEFVEGAKEGITSGLNLFPYLLAMILGVNIFIKSGVINHILGTFDGLFNLLNVNPDIVPLILLRPISGSSSLIVMKDIFINHGPDSFLGTLASIIQGSTDTTMYILTIYFGSIGIKKIKYSLFVGLIADLISVITSMIIVSLFF